MSPLQMSAGQDQQVKQHVRKYNKNRIQYLLYIFNNMHSYNEYWQFVKVQANRDQYELMQ